jgi:predicted NUDIX family phosphoesterase
MFSWKYQKKIEILYNNFNGVSFIVTDAIDRCFLFQRCEGGSEFCRLYCQVQFGFTGGHCRIGGQYCCCD